ncbi:Mg2+ transporter protein CorA-like/Zinc transport protein ZntB [Penicillium expansum]|nr:Mg2+ transporter protein CorA-like/Zinc transport protein ZntB [Penicillium expansum]
MSMHYTNSIHHNKGERGCREYQLEIVKKLLQEDHDLIKKEFDYTFNEDDPEESWTSRGMTPLAFAARLDRFEISKLLLEEGADVFAKTKSNGTNTFWLAVLHEHLELADILLDRGTKSLLELRSDFGDTALIRFAFLGELKLVAYLLGKEADITAMEDESGDTALHVAAIEGHFEVVQMLWNARPAEIDILELRNKSGQTSLLAAAQCNQSEITKFLLDEGAKYDVQDNDGNTPLHYAAMTNDLELAQRLPKNEERSSESPDQLNADNKSKYSTILNRQNKNQDTPIVLTASSEQTSVFDFLLKSGANLNVRVKNGDTVLHRAAQTGNLDIVKKLLPAPAENPCPLKVQGNDPSTHQKGNGTTDFATSLGNFDLLKNHLGSTGNEQLQHVKNMLGQTPMMLAAQEEMFEVVEYLLGKNETFTSKGMNLEKAMLSSAENGYIRLIQGLWEVSDLREIQDSSGRTPLLIASDEGHAKIVEYLCQNGAKLGVKDDAGYTPILNAVWTDSVAMVKCLLNHGADQAATGTLGMMRKACLDVEFIIKSVVSMHAIMEKRHFSIITNRMIAGHTGKKGDKLEASTSNILEWTARYEFSLAFCWLLSSGDYFGEDHIKSCENAIKSSVSGNKKHNGRLIIEALLQNPPPIRTRKGDTKAPEFLYSIPYDETRMGTVIEISRTERQIYHNLNLKRSEIFEFVYDGPETPMKNDDTYTCKAIIEKLRSAQLEIETNQAQGDSEIKKDAKPKGREWSGIQSSQEKVRWLHIPVNDLRFVQELMVQVSRERGRDNNFYRSLIEFCQGSMLELAAGDGNHYMMPHFQSARNSTTEKNERSKGDLNVLGEKKNFDGVALYMPYLHWGVKPDREKKKSSSQFILNQDSSEEEKIKQSFGFKNYLHGSLTLDEYYYAALGNIDERDDDQVVGRYFAKQLELKQEPEPKDENKSPPARPILLVNQLWLWIIDDAVSESEETTTFVQRVIIELRKENGNSVPKAMRVAEVIRDTATNLFDAKEIEFLRSGKKSPLDIFRESIQEITLVRDQQHVCSLWKGPREKTQVEGDYSSVDERDAVIVEMIRDAQSLQDAINKLLDLKQKQATIMEAQATRRQSDSVMVFTVVTVVFLPASFLASLFALDIAEFAHVNGGVVFQGRWIFPIIFGVAFAFALVFLPLAFKANLFKNIFKLWRCKREPGSDEESGGPAKGSSYEAPSTGEQTHRSSGGSGRQS